MDAPATAPLYRGGGRAGGFSRGRPAGMASTTLARFACWKQFNVGINERLVPVAVVMAYLLHAVGQVVFVPSLRNDIQQIVDTDEDVETPRERGVGMEHFTLGILAEDADSGALR